MSMVDIKALETSCALAGSGSVRAQPPLEAAVETAPSSPSGCFDTISIGAAILTGANADMHARRTDTSCLKLIASVNSSLSTPSVSGLGRLAVLALQGTFELLVRSWAHVAAAGQTHQQQIASVVMLRFM